MRRPLIACSFAIAFVFAGCVDPPPPPKVAPPPPQVMAEPTAKAPPEEPTLGDGTEASPYKLVPGRKQPFQITPPLLREVGIVLEGQADLVLSWGGAGAGPLEVVHTGQNTNCEKSPCVLPLSIAGEYQLRLKSGPKQTITASALALPAAVPLQAGKAIVLRPKPVLEGDPRGAIADCEMRFERGGERSIDLRPLGKKRAGDLKGLLEKVHVGVYKSDGLVQVETTLSPDVGGALRLTFDSESGPYVLRLTRETEDMADAIEVKLKKTPDTKPALGGIRGLPSREGFASLKVGEKVNVEVAPQEEPKMAYFELPPDNDMLILRPESQTSPVPWVEARVDWPGGSKTRTCPRDFRVCPAWWPHAGVYRLFAPPQSPAPTGTVEILALPRPKLAGPLEAGNKLDVTMEPLVKADPRGAIADVGLHVAAPGKYEVILTLVDGPAPGDKSTGPLGPDLYLFPEQALQQKALVDRLTSLDPTSTRATMTLDVSMAGTYMLRVGMQGDTEHSEELQKPRKLRAEFVEHKLPNSN